MKAIFNKDTNHSLEIIEDRNKMIASLKEAGVRFGKTSLNELIDGKRDVVNGYVVMDVSPTEEKEPVEAEKAAEQPKAEDEKEAAPAAEATKTDEKPAEEKKTRVRAGIKAHDAKGKLKPVRKGTKIADGLEMLLKGATEEELKKAELSDDIVDFVNRRVTKRGYGIKVADGKVNLVLPEGVKDISYTTAAEKEDEKPAQPVPQEADKGSEAATA